MSGLHLPFSGVRKPRSDLGHAYGLAILWREVVKPLSEILAGWKDVRECWILVWRSSSLAQLSNENPAILEEFTREDENPRSEVGCACVETQLLVRMSFQDSFAVRRRLILIQGAQI